MSARNTTRLKGALFGLASTSAMLWASTALPCGGAFGPNMTVDPSQTLLVSHKQGVETYVFRPHFCGEAAQFGLILPIPSALAKNPTLAAKELFDELDKLSAPKITKKQVCRGDSLQAGGAPGAANDGSSKGIDVVNKGQVGIFDWTLVKAETKEAFTDWLDANGFPHDPDADTQFAHYVKEGFHFVAFKVTASDTAPAAGKKICGDFGPIELAFPAAKPLIPTRIASVSANGQSPVWKIYGLSSHDEQLAITSQSSYPGFPTYSDEMTSASLANTPELAKLAAPGDQLVRLHVGFAFNGLDKDLLLSSTKPTQLLPTAEQIEYVDCPDGKVPVTPGSGSGEAFDGPTPRSGADDGCAVSTDGPARGVTTLALSLAAVLLVRRRRRAS